MMSERVNDLYAFGPFLLDAVNGLLLHEGKSLLITPKAFDTLLVLVQENGRVLSKDELMQRIWPNVTVEENNLTQNISTLRKVLREVQDGQQYIETIPKRGYRFIYKVEKLAYDSADTAQGHIRSNPENSASLKSLILQMLDKDPYLRPTAEEVRKALAQFAKSGVNVRENPETVLCKRHTVGRENERSELLEAFESVKAGRGLLFCVAGEAGIGKTTLVEDFLAELTATGHAFSIARGRCSERLAGTEAYLPFIEALDSLLRNDTSESIARMMRLIAPTWYTQIIPVVANDTAAIDTMAKATSQERMKRELSTFLQEISLVTTLVLFFDDLHWADISTVDLLAYLATKSESMRVLVVATYRSSELLLTKHPFLQLKLDLQSRGACFEIALRFLNRQDIKHYLALEFPEHRFPAEFPALIHTKTEGNPLFMVDLVRYLRDLKVVEEKEGRWELARLVPDLERELPVSVRSLIQRKIDQLSEDDRRLLVVASVQGYQFDSAVVSKAFALDQVVVEDRLEVLERVYGFVHLVGADELPNGSLTLCYRFIHVLYQNALYASLRPTRRVSLSDMVAKSLLECHEEQAAPAELAVLFEAARDFAHASDYFLIATQNAARMFANQEAIKLACRGLELLKMLPDRPERAQKELMLQITLGGPLSAINGWASPEVERTYGRARELCRQIGETSQLFPVVHGLWRFYLIRAELQTAHNLGERLLSLVQNAQESQLLIEGHRALGTTLFYLGKLASARTHLEHGIALCDSQQDRSHTVLFVNNPEVTRLSHAAWALWLLGYPDQAMRRSNEALTLARELSHPFSLAYARYFAAALHQSCRRIQAAQDQAESVIALSIEQGFELWLAAGTIFRGRALAEHGQAEEGITQIRDGIEATRATGAELWQPYLLSLLAEAYAKVGETEKGLIVLAEALAKAHNNGELFYEAELHRLEGELLLTLPTDNTQKAEACFDRAIQLARLQDAKSLELRAVMSMSRLWLKQDKGEQARKVLSEIYYWFAEGFETADLKETKTLLEELS
jgi:predicted ATPase/DNA-binding winged helix-turn-helix (wHTH) protein